MLQSDLQSLLSILIIGDDNSLHESFPARDKIINFFLPNLSTMKIVIETQQTFNTPTITVPKAGSSMPAVSKIVVE